METSELDPLLTDPVNLAGLAMLTGVASVRFGLLQDELELSEFELSQQLEVLADAGYVKARWLRFGPRRNHWYAITSAGENALEAHLYAVNELARQSLPPPTRDLSVS